MSQRTVTFYGLEAEVISAAIKQKDSRIAELEAQRDELLAAIEEKNTALGLSYPTITNIATYLRSKQDYTDTDAAIELEQVARKQHKAIKATPSYDPIKQQLAERDKRILMSKAALDNIYAFGTWRDREIADEALAAINDSKLVDGLVLCDTKPVNLYPCGFDGLAKIIIESGAYLARSLVENEPVTENQRAEVMRLISYARDMVLLLSRQPLFAQRKP